MGLFGRALDLRYDPVEAAYRLHRDGEVSQPFKTQFEAKRAHERKSVFWRAA